MIAIRTRRKIAELGIALVVFIVLVVLVAVLTLLVSQKQVGFAESFVHGLLALPVFLGAWFLLEYVGTKVIGLPFWQRLPAAGRVVLLVGLIVALALLVLAVVHSH